MKASNISINTCPILRFGKITDMSKRRKIHPTKIAKKEKSQCLRPPNRESPESPTRERSFEKLENEGSMSIETEGASENDS